MFQLVEAVGYTLNVRESVIQLSAKTTILFLVKMAETLSGVYTASYPMVTREFCGVTDQGVKPATYPF